MGGRKFGQNPKEQQFFFGKPSLRLNANFDIAIGQKKSVAKGENGAMFIC